MIILIKNYRQYKKQLNYNYQWIFYKIFILFFLGTWFKKFDLSSLTSCSMAGERCDVPTYNWIEKHLGVLINDNYW